MGTLLYPITKGSKFSPSYATEYQHKTSKVVMTEGESWEAGHTTTSKSPSGNDTCHFCLWSIGQN